MREEGIRVKPETRIYESWGTDELYAAILTILKGLLL